MLKPSRYIYLAWGCLAVNLREGLIPSLAEFSRTVVFDTGIGVRLTVFTLFTYIVFAYLISKLGRGIQYGTDMARQSQMMTLIYTTVFVMGIVAIADMSIAFASGDDIFLTQLIFDLVKNPPSPDVLIGQGLNGTVYSVAEVNNSSALINGV